MPAHDRMALALIALGSAALPGCGPSSRPDAAPADRPGAAATAILQASSPRLRVRVDYREELPPSPRALDLLERRLRDRCHKPWGVVVERGVVLGGERRAVYGETALRELADSAAPLVAEPGEVVIQALYLEGRSELDHHDDVQLGIGFSARRLAVFRATLEAQSLPLPSEKLEAAVLLHEVGHLLGLVGHGAPLTRPHLAPSRLGHCVNRGCIMAARCNDWGLFGLFSEASEPDFCADCVADLRALGGR